MYVGWGGVCLSAKVLVFVTERLLDGCHGLCSVCVGYCASELNRTKVLLQPRCGTMDKLRSHQVLNLY